MNKKKSQYHNIITILEKRCWRNHDVIKAKKFYLNKIHFSFKISIFIKFHLNDNGNKGYSSRVGWKSIQFKIGQDEFGVFFSNFLIHAFIFYVLLYGCSLIILVKQKKAEAFELRFIKKKLSRSCAVLKILISTYRLIPCKKYKINPSIKGLTRQRFNIVYITILKYQSIFGNTPQ